MVIGCLLLDVYGVGGFLHCGGSSSTLAACSCVFLHWDGIGVFAALVLAGMLWPVTPGCGCALW